MDRINKKLISLLLIALFSIITFTACSSGSATTEQSEDNMTEESADLGITATSANATYPEYFDVSGQFTERDLEGTYDDNVTEVKLSGNSASTSGNGATADGGTITISSAGTYVFSGKLDDGQIIVNADENDKVQIVLNGVDITNDDSACILVLSADKVFVTVADDTENSLSDTGDTYTQDSSDYNIVGVIFSREDLVINGKGKLSIDAGYKHAIVGKDDLKLANVTLDIEAAGKGIVANDSIRITSGTYNIKTTDDAIHTSEAKDGKGYVYIADGTFELASGDDGIHAETGLIIDGGKIDVTDSYEALEGHTIDINGGDMNVVASDDGLNAAGGSGNNKAEEDAIQHDGPMMDYHEGTEYYGDMADEVSAESSDITVSTTDYMDAYQDVTTDETAAKGPGGMGGGMMMDTDQDAYLVINGGNLFVNAEGDGLDSNGTLIVNGGTVIVEGPTGNGNGALDCGLGATINGGSVIAVGSSGMAETFGDGSKQYSILYNFSSQISAGTEVKLTDSDGNEIMSYTPNKSYQSVVISFENIKDGNYTISAGSDSETIEVSSVSTSAGSGGGFNGGHGGMRGGSDNGGGQRHNG